MLTEYKNEYFSFQARYKCKKSQIQNTILLKKSQNLSTDNVLTFKFDIRSNILAKNRKSILLNSKCMFRTWRHAWVASSFHVNCVKMPIGILRIY